MTHTESSHPYKQHHTKRGWVVHTIRLSNGSVVRLEEELEELSISQQNPSDEDDYTYICSILPYGTLVMPNSGDATEELVRNLNVEEEDRI